MKLTISNDISRLRYGALLLMAVWMIGIGTSMTWNIYKEWDDTEEFALIESRAIVFKDIIFRKWNSGHSGVYVPVTKETIPNKYLDVPNRDITLPNGKLYTLVNPAYMTRQVFELQEKEQGILGHLTSLKPIRFENAPDRWEKIALGEFQLGKKEVSSLNTINSRLYMRYMQPLFVEESCLACHAKQGYRKGDIRGGISVALPMDSFRKIALAHIPVLVLSHCAILILGLAGIFAWYRNSRIRTIERERAVEELLVKETAIATSSNGIVITGLDGDISYSNESFRKMWRYNSDAVILGTSVFSRLKIDRPDEVLATIRDLGNWYGEIDAVRDDGSEFHVLLSAAMICGEDDRNIGMTFSFSDISMRKNAEQALKKSEERLRERNETMERDLKIAQLVQRDLITQDVPAIPYLDIKFRYMPADRVGGDYFNFFPLREQGLGLFIGDVSGHGVASALFHSLIKSSTDKLCRPYCTKPNEFLFHLNKDLFGHMTTYFITAIYGSFSLVPGTREVRFNFAIAGHPPPIIIHGNGAMETINAEGSVIGINENFQFEEKTIILKTGDRMFFYTDGIPETENEKREILGYDEPLMQLIRNSQRDTMEGTLGDVISRLNAFRGTAEYKDDVLLIGIEIL